jgi:hypothetical protein
MADLLHVLHSHLSVQSSGHLTKCNYQTQKWHHQLGQGLESSVFCIWNGSPAPLHLKLHCTSRKCATRCTLNFVSFLTGGKGMKQAFVSRNTIPIWDLIFPRWWKDCGLSSGRTSCISYPETEAVVSSKTLEIPTRLFCVTTQRSKLTKTKLHGLSPRANYTDRATAACWRSNCQLLRIEGATWSAW